ncbi:MAG: hypothetical protein K0R57_5762 [Paenibacillaceae bacterium]|jgi:uncharacterized protein YvpB|nr:hypothetical protein [Paenibacillaceae bacterium]
MGKLWNVLKYMAGFFMLVGLVFSSGVFSVLLYGRITGKEWAFSYKYVEAAPYAGVLAEPPSASPSPSPAPSARPEKKASVLLEAPIYRQHPELPSGCEITSLAMLLNYAGVAKTKMELLPDMPRDPTPMTKKADGTPAFWGNPNVGFVGEITGKGRGFGIYHGALFQLLEKYLPTAVDLTRGSFDELEQRLSEGIPSVVWTTIDFKVPPPGKWLTWETPTGPIETTFMEHAVLLVGYDEESVYVNDPWTGKGKFAVNKAQFIETWEVMGQQALSYDPAS